jgi:hypothetical protein
MTNFLINLLMVLLGMFVFDGNVFAEVEFEPTRFYKIKNEKSCVVKRYEDKAFHDELLVDFSKMEIQAKPYGKNEKFSVFKFNQKIFVVLTSCLEPIENFVENEIKPQKKKKNKLVIEPSKRSYMLQLSFGKPFITSQEPVFEYDQLDGINCDESNPTETCDFTDPPSAEYGTGASISAKFGWASTNGNFWLASYKTFKGKKQEIATVDITNVGSGTSTFTFEDRFTHLTFGKKYIFNEKSSFRPHLSVLGGLSMITSTETSTGAEFQSSGLVFDTEAGVEFMLSDNFGLGLVLGYEFLGTRTFILKEKGDEETKKGFKTRQDYSNIYLELGIVSYF